MEESISRMEESQMSRHSVKRHHKHLESLLKQNLPIPFKNKNCLQTCATSPNTQLTPSYIFTPQPQKADDSLHNQTIRYKASFLMSLNRTMEAEFKKSFDPIKSNDKRECKLSLMVSPKKKPSKINFRGTFKPQFRSKQRFTDQARKIQTMKCGELRNLLESESIHEGHKDITQQRHIGSLQHYFSLAFIKFFAKERTKTIKQRVTVLAECIWEKYRKNPEGIAEDVRDIKGIERILNNGLHSKQNKPHINPCQGLDINGDLARLFFNMTHFIIAWKYKNYDLWKIYFELEYYSRKLEFHQFTLHLCFEIGEFFNHKNDEENAYKYFGKALKLSIFLGDTFSEQKAIDKLGASTYSGSKISLANYFHSNIHNLSGFDRQIIKQSYSNQKQIENLIKVRKTFMINKKNQPDNELQKIYEQKREMYNFETEMELLDNFQIQNRKCFQKNISKYIACPQMRTGTLVAKKHMEKINNLGKLKRLKDWDGRLLKGFSKCRHKQDFDSSNEVMLTHRSLNRINPQLQIRQIKRQKALLIELIGYFTNSIINSFI